MRNRSRPRSPSDLSLLLITLVLASGLLWAMQRSGQLAILAKGLSQLTSPLQWRISVEALRLPEAFRQIAQTQLTREEQLVLQAENKQLTSENIVLQEILRENESLRSQLGYADLNPRFTFMSAHVVGQILGHDPHSFLDYLLIGAGISDGLEIGMPVITPLGLVGRIADVAPHTSRVLLIQDVSSSVSGLMQSSRVNGQVVGTSDGSLRMQFITSSDPVAVGESVVTSHLSASLPQGIPIGTVLSLEEQRNSTIIFAMLRPAVDFSLLEEVMVITNYEPLNEAPPLEIAPESGP